MRKSIAVVLLAAFAAVSAAQLSADVIPPIGLAPGSQYQLIFVTAGTRDAASTDITDYNTFVSNEAALNPLLPQNVTWRAVGSTSNKGGNPVDAITNAPNGINAPWGNLPVYNTQGLEVSDGSGYGLYNTLPLLNPIEFDQYGNPSTAGGVNNSVWTGSDVDGRGDPSYELGAPASNGTVFGNPYVTYPWLGGGAATAANPFNHLPLYALSSPITVPTPEPSSLVLAALGLLGLAAWGWRRKR